MHELSLCRAIMNIVNEAMIQKPHQRVTQITLEIGQLSAVDGSALRFGFDVVTKGTAAEQAILEIISIPGKARCESCQKVSKIKHYYDVCQHCGLFPLLITHGEELRVKSLEIE